MRIVILGCSLLLGAAMVSAEGKKGGANKAAVLEEGRKVFETNCAACHGPEGKGDGAAAAALEPKPRNLTDAKYMKSRPVADLRKVITEGGQSAGLSPVMVGWKAALGPDQIEAVLQYVLTLSRKKPTKLAAAGTVH